MPPTGFEPGSERPQTHALDRAATEIGFGNEYLPINHKYSSYVLLIADLLYRDLKFVQVCCFLSRLLSPGNYTAC